MEVNGSYRYIATDAFPYGPGCLWGEPSDDIPEILCWKAQEYWNLMELTNFTLYSDCEEDLFAESNGTAGCVSYLSNPQWYVDQGRGTMTTFNAIYVSSCSDPDNQYENSVAEDLPGDETEDAEEEGESSSTSSSLELNELAGGAILILACSGLLNFMLTLLHNRNSNVLTAVDQV
jgi:hypothetical protein